MNTQQQSNQPDYIWAYAGIPNALYTDTIFKFNNGYTVRISDDLEREVRSNNIEVDTWGVAMVFHKDRDMAVAEYHYYDDYNEKDGYGKSSEIWFVDEETGENDPESFEGYNVDILGNPNWKEDLAKAMVYFAVSKEVETGLNADKEFSGSPEIVSVVRENYATAQRYAQNATKNPVFLEKDDNTHQTVTPFDDFVAAAMKDTGDSRDEVVELASEAFRSQYQAASGYLRGVSDGSVMYNAFDIEMDDKTYYATAPLEWVKEQARVGLSDRGYALEVARHNFLHSSLNGWETAFHQLKAAADDYKQWRNQVCAFFNFRQPEITLQQGEWTQVAQFVGYDQEWEQLDNARLMISEFTPQQAYEFLGVYQQYQRYVRLAIHNAEQGIDSLELRTQIAAIKQSLNEKVAQNLPQTENRQVMFDLFGTQLGLFDEETQEQGVGVSESPENSGESQSETVSMEEFDRRLLSAFGGEDSTGFQNQKMYDYYSKKDGVSIYHPNGLMNKPLEILSFSELEDRYGVLDYHFNAQTSQTQIDEMRAIKALLEVKGLEIIATAADNYTPKNAVIALWAKNNGFEFELATNDREVFQKGNLKLQVANISSYVVGELEPQWIGGRVSLVQFDKSLPTTEIRKQNEIEQNEIEQNAIKPIRHETVFIWDIRKETTDEFGRLSQFLSEMEQGIGVSATSENSQERQPEPYLESETELNDKLLAKIKAVYPDETNRSIRQKLDIWTDENYIFLENGFEKTKELFPKAFSGNLNIENSKTTPLSKEQKAELKAAKDDLTVAKKELKGLRDELKNTRPHQVEYYLQWREETRQAISEKQEQVRELSRQYDELSFSLKTQTGEITDLEKEILTARLSGSLKERFDIAFRELKSQRKEIGVEYDELKARIDNKDFYEFEIQSVMQDAVAYYGGSRGMATLYHNGKELPLTTDRDKAIAYLLQVELPKQLHDEFGKPFNALARKISKLGNAEYYIKHGSSEWGKDIEAYIDLLEDTENQLMKGSIEERAEINLTYDINTEYGKQKIRELFYGSRHDQPQAELFERVFAMAQKLNVEVRHALRNPHTTFSKRNATTMVAGWYQLNENSARVKHGGNIQVEEKGEVLLHELVHSVTSRAMFLKEQGRTELLNPAQIKAIEEIEKIYQAVLGKAEELGFEKYQTVSKNGVETYQGDYGLKNSHEFIAELSNPVFREKLKQVAMFDETVKAMTEVATGVEKTETAYDRLTAALYQIMDNYEPDFGAKYEQAKYGNIKMNDIFRQPEKENQMEQTTQTAANGGFSLDDKKSRNANLFLSATKALLYRDLENAVRWHNHFIEESKEIPVPQSVIDIQTKRIEEYSKELNERLYGDERQKYRDMFPEQIEEIKQDFKKILEDLETSPENTVKQDAFGLPEQSKEIIDNRTFVEQALKDGERLKNAQDKASDCYYELQKQPENPQRQEAYKQAQAEVNAIENELKPKVEQAMKDGKPFVVWYVDNWKEYNDNKPSPIELVVSPKGELQQAMGTLSNPKNLAKVRNCILHNQRGEVTLNAEQRSSPERTAEVLRWNFDNFARSIPTQMSVINHQMADKVFSEKEIKDTLNKALVSKFEDVRLLAIHSPQMKDKWLQKVAKTHPCPITVQEAHKVLENRQSNLSDNLKNEQTTADKGGFSLSATQPNAAQQAVVVKQVMQSQTTVKSHRMRH